MDILYRFCESIYSGIVSLCYRNAALSELPGDLERLRREGQCFVEPKHVKGARKRLESGTPRKTVCAIFGEAVVLFAEREIAHKPQ